MSASEKVNKVSTCLPMVGADKFHYAHVLRALQNPFGFHQVFPELRSGHDGVGHGDYVEAALARGPGQPLNLSVSPSPCTRGRAHPMSNASALGVRTSMFIAHAQDVKGGTGQSFSLIKAMQVL